MPLWSACALKLATPAEVVQVANDNCPGQVVISGAAPASRALDPLCAAVWVSKDRPLAVSIAAHSPLMLKRPGQIQPGTSKMHRFPTRLSFDCNVSATPLTTAAEIRADLRMQLTSRGRWTESMPRNATTRCENFPRVGQWLGIDRLLKRIDEGLVGLALGAPADFEKLSAG